MELIKCIQWILLLHVSLVLMPLTQSDEVTGVPEVATEVPAALDSVGGEASASPGGETVVDVVSSEPEPDSAVSDPPEVPKAVIVEAPSVAPESQDEVGVTTGSVAETEPPLVEEVIKPATAAGTGDKGVILFTTQQQDAATESGAAITQAAVTQQDPAAAAETTGLKLPESVQVTTQPAAADSQTTQAPSVTGAMKQQSSSGTVVQETTPAVAAALTTAEQPQADTQTTQGSEVEAEITTVKAPATSTKKIVTTEKEALETIVPTIKSNDPCDNYELLSEDQRYIENQGSPNTYLCDQLKEKWYAFKYQTKWAEIPAVPVKPSYCGTLAPFRLSLTADQTLPEFNETISAQICTSVSVFGDLEECALKRDIEIKRCTDHYIYYLQPLTKKCSSAVCTKLMGENVSQITFGPEPTGTATKKPLPIKQIPVQSLSPAENNGVVTVEYSYPHSTLDEDSFIVFEKKFRAAVIKELNKQAAAAAELTTAASQQSGNDAVTQESVVTVSGRIKRQAGTTPQYTEDDITHVNPTPRVKDGKLQMSIVVKDKNGNVVPAYVLKQALENMENPSDDPAVKQEKVFTGLPSDIAPTEAPKKKSIWEAHLGLWITIITLMGVCILTLLICCLCFRCCEAPPYHHEKSLLQAEEGKKMPSFVVENPLPDEDITKDETQMVEHENPAATSTPNGAGHDMKPDDNGYVKPKDQQKEGGKPKVKEENTKL